MTIVSNEPFGNGDIDSIHLVREQLLEEHGGSLQDYFDASCKRQADFANNLISEPVRPARNAVDSGT